MKVRVKAPWQIVHGGERYTDGDTVDAPEPEAKRWVRIGLAEEVEDKPKARKQPKPRHAARQSPEPVKPQAKPVSKKDD